MAKATGALRPEAEQRRGSAGVPAPHGRARSERQRSIKRAVLKAANPKGALSKAQDTRKSQDSKATMAGATRMA